MVWSVMCDVGVSGDGDSAICDSGGVSDMCDVGVSGDGDSAICDSGVSVMCVMLVSVVMVTV